MSSISIITVHAVLSLVANLSEEEGLPSRLLLSEVGGAKPPAEEQTIASLDGGLRIIFPGGDVVTGGGPKYGDLFGVGVGGGLSFSYLWRTSKSFWLGPYAEIDVDQFGGKRSTDSFGDSILPASMTTVRGLVGIKLREAFSPGSSFFGEQTMGFGAIRYPSVKSTVTSGGVSIDGQELFGSSTKFAFDLGAALGYRVSAQFELTFGFSLQIDAGPAKGADVQIVTLTSSGTPQDMINFGLTFGANFRF